jgi:hypothetical protein
LAPTDREDRVFDRSTVSSNGLGFARGTRSRFRESLGKTTVISCRHDREPLLVPDSVLDDLAADLALVRGYAPDGTIDGSTLPEPGVAGNALAIKSALLPDSEHESDESLAEISRGTPDEDRVLACLARAWETSPQEQKPAIARALRRLSPKSEQLVAGLRQWPADGTGSQIRRYRFPRSRRGFPVPE